MRNISLLSLCLFSIFSLAMNSEPLDGNKFNVKVMPEGGGKEFSDTLGFDHGKFTSQYLLKKGFKPADYEEDTHSFGPAMFSVTLKSETDGDAKWTGTVATIEVRGELAWTKKDGTVVNYSYSGERADR